jgi:hypothetical protein
MLLSNFQRFSPLLQLAHVLRHGVFLAQRWQGASSIDLFYCDDTGRGFFVEVGTDDTWRQVVVLRSFAGSSLLDAYAQEV